jgi:hypothetical protein
MMRNLTELAIERYDSSLQSPLRERVVCEVAMKRPIAGWWKGAKLVRCFYDLRVEVVKQAWRAYDFNMDLPVSVWEMP